MKKRLRYRHIFKTKFLQKLAKTSKLYDRFCSLTSAKKPQSSLVFISASLKSIVTVTVTRCTKCWSSLTFECNANTFVNVDTQIEEEWRRTISPVCKGILAQSFTATKWVVRNLRRKQFAIQGEQLYAEWGARLKNFHSSNLLCICLSLFETVMCYEILSSKFDLRFYMCSLVRRPECF